jgi:hypothetical protein
MSDLFSLLTITEFQKKPSVIDLHVSIFGIAPRGEKNWCNIEDGSTLDVGINLFSTSLVTLTSYVVVTLHMIFAQSQSFKAVC